MIKEQLLKEALDFANSYVNMPEDDKKIINHARHILLFSKQQTSIKMESRLLDVTMGTYDRAEVCELVGSLLLYALSLKYIKTKIGYTGIKGGSRAAVTSKMERFVIIVNSCKPLTIITKRSILDVAAVLYPPLGMTDYQILEILAANIVRKLKRNFRSFFGSTAYN